MSIGNMEGGDTIETSRTAPLMIRIKYSSPFEVVKAEVKNNCQTLAKKQAKKHWRVILDIEFLLRMKYSENHGHLQSKYWGGRKESQEHVGYVQPNGQQFKLAQEKLKELP
ncbi:hypothetical protein HD554DRAFT_2036423 [Boletus coccyginus]|nr:hypothetical protein HD554DRAFT_2036423 [Boletus coccyginus]